jgi:hypothetical protein
MHTGCQHVIVRRHGGRRRLPPARCRRRAEARHQRRVRRRERGAVTAPAPRRTRGVSPVSRRLTDARDGRGASDGRRHAGTTVSGPWRGSRAAAIRSALLSHVPPIVLPLSLTSRTGGSGGRGHAQRARRASPRTTTSGRGEGSGRRSRACGRPSRTGAGGWPLSASARARGELRDCGRGGQGASSASPRRAWRRCAVRAQRRRARGRQSGAESSCG